MTALFTQRQAPMPDSEVVRSILLNDNHNLLSIRSIVILVFLLSRNNLSKSGMKIWMAWNVSSLKEESLPDCLKMKSVKTKFVANLYYY